MYKIIYIFLLNFIFVINIYAEDIDKVSFGIGMAWSENVYKSTDNNIRVFPAINLNYKNFYFRGIEAGYRLYDEKKINLSLITFYSFDGYKSKDGDYLVGMEDKKNEIRLGLNFEYEIMRGLAVKYKVARDITGKSEGITSDLILRTGYPLRKNFIFISSVGINYSDYNTCYIICVIKS